MPKPKRLMKSSFSVAMSQDTGCIVMVRTNGQKVTVIGSLTKKQSEDFAQSILHWEPPRPAPGGILESAAPEAAPAPRPIYPH